MTASLPVFEKLFLLLLQIFCARLFVAADLGEQLVSDVLANCSRNLRPVVDVNNQVVVGVDFIINQINSLDVVDQVLDLSLFIGLSWRNEKVSWDTADYDGHDRVFLTQDDNTWLPDIVFYNQISGHHITRDLPVPFMVNSSGHTYMSRPLRADFLCALNAYYFPFDQHVCRQKIGPWINPTDLIDVQNDAAITSNILTSSTSWEVVGVNAEHMKFYRDRNFSSIVYSVHLKRRSAFYVANVIIPSVAINYLTLFNFVIPANSEEKITYGVTIFLAQTVNMMMVSNMMPHGASSIPLFGQYLLFSIIFIASSLLVTIFLVSSFIDQMSDQSYGGKVLRFALKNISPILGPKIPRRDVSGGDKKVEELALDDKSADKISAKDSVPDNTVQGGESKTNKRNGSKKASVEDLTHDEQILIGCVTLNRACFLFSFLLMTVMTSAYMIILNTTSDNEIQPSQFSA